MPKRELQPLRIGRRHVGWRRQLNRVNPDVVLEGFAIGYDLLPHTSEPSLAKSRPVIDYLCYEIMTFTTVGYGDIVPDSAQGKLLAICTALLGATHGVTFVALGLQALTQHPPAKNQESI
jgi:hypothetical protein